MATIILRNGYHGEGATAIVLTNEEKALFPPSFIGSSELLTATIGLNNLFDSGDYLEVTLGGVFSGFGRDVNGLSGNLDVYNDGTNGDGIGWLLSFTINNVIPGNGWDFNFVGHDLQFTTGNVSNFWTNLINTTQT